MEERETGPPFYIAFTMQIRECRWLPLLFFGLQPCLEPCGACAVECIDGLGLYARTSSASSAGSLADVSSSALLLSGARRRFGLLETSSFEWPGIPVVQALGRVGQLDPEPLDGQAKGARLRLAEALSFRR
jgi:hypothetical protein